MDTQTHPITEAVASVRAALGQVRDRPAWSLSPEQVVLLLGELAGARAELAELELRVAAQADHDDLATTHAAATTHALWAAHSAQTRPVAKRRLRLALALDAERVTTREAMAAGHVAEDQAAVIVEAVDALPVTGEHALPPAVVEQAEKELVRLASLPDAPFDAHALRHAGRTILERVAPELAEAHERRAVEAAEARAARKTSFTMSRDGHGLVHGRFTLSTLAADQLRKMVASCWHPSMGDGPTGQGAAFTQLIERISTQAVPTAGGTNATVTVLMTLEQLRGDLDASGVVPLDTGSTITAGEARRLACEAGIIPLVLGSTSAVLDVGRQSRFHTKPQRVAIAWRDKTCTAEGCDVPPGFCHVHHDDQWALGGRTSVEKGRLLCPAHHRMIHSGLYTISISKHGRLIFRRT